MSRIIPANPGYFMVWQSRGELIKGEPVIGWSCPEVGPAYPIYADAHRPEMTDREGYMGTIWPDGRVEYQGEIYESLQAAQNNRMKL